jgi:hypothetical protein
VEDGTAPTATPAKRKELPVHELNARAALVPAPNVADGLATTVSREAVADALSAEGPIELILDVTSYSGEGEPTETRNIAVAWERSDLERLLREGSDRIQLTFDREAIEAAMADVEAHGLREKALVFAVAVTAAAGGATVASAANTLDTGGAAGGSSSYITQEQATTPGVPASLTASGVDDTASTPVPPALTSSGVDDTASTPVPPALTSSGVDDTAFTQNVADRSAPTSLSPDSRAVDFSTPTPEPSLSPDSRAVDFSTPTPEPSLSPDSRDVSFASPDTAFPTVGVDDRAVDRTWPEPATPIATADDGGISIEAPGPEAVALGGAIALALTAAAFVVAGRRRVTPV